MDKEQKINFVTNGQRTKAKLQFDLIKRIEIALYNINLKIHNIV